MPNQRNYASENTVLCVQKETGAIHDLILLMKANKIIHYSLKYLPIVVKIKLTRALCINVTKPQDNAK